MKNNIINQIDIDISSLISLILMTTRKDFEPNFDSIEKIVNQ